MKHFSPLLLFCFLMIYISPSGYSRSADDAIPYFVLKVDIRDYNFSLYLNDVPILPTSIERQGASTDFEFPLNPYIFLGNNTLTAHLLPLTNSGVNGTSPKAKITLLQYKHFKSETISIITEINYNGTLKNNKGVKLNKVFALSSSLPKWAWQTSDTIAKTKATHQALIAQYQEIWNAIEQKKAETILPLFEERNQETALAFHKPKEYYGDKMKRLITIANDSEMELFPLEPEDSILEVFGNGRLAKLTRWDGLPMIGFNFKDDSGSEAFDIIFRKQGNQWIITR